MLYAKTSQLAPDVSFEKKLFLLSGCKLKNSDAAALAAAADPAVRYTVKFFNDLSEFKSFVCDTMTCGNIVSFSQPVGRVSGNELTASECLEACRTDSHFDHLSTTAFVYRTAIENPVYGVCVRNYIACYVPCVRME